jgi:hypothetical protein
MPEQVHHQKMSLDLKYSFKFIKLVYTYPRPLFDFRKLKANLFKQLPDGNNNFQDGGKPRPNNRVLINKRLLKK